jgi:hypothetical protein
MGADVDIGVSRAPRPPRNSADIQAELYKIVGTETARRLMGLYIQNKAQVDRDKGLYGNVIPADAYNNAVTKDYVQNVKNVHDAFGNMLEAFGAPTVPFAIGAMTHLADAMNALAKVAIEHSDTAAFVGEAAIITSGLAVIGGAILSFAGIIALSRITLGLLTGGSAAAGAVAGTAATGGGAGWFASLLGRVGLPAATLYYEDQIKVGLRRASSARRAEQKRLPMFEGICGAASIPARRWDQRRLILPTSDRMG